MSRILYAWELGLDLGHIQRFLPFAAHLSSRGHEVIFAAKDLSRIQSLPGARAFETIQSPVWLTTVEGLPEPQVCYADILQRIGYLASDGLLGMVKGWRSIFSRVAPQLLVVDHAPTALLASRDLNFPRITYGSGFYSPPRSAPMPSMRPWLSLPANRIEDSEAAVLRTVNQVLAELGGRPMAALADLFAVDDALWMTAAELDHYPQRGPTRYLGPVLGVQGGATPDWPAGSGKKLFAYIKMDHPQSGRLLEQLAGSPYDVLAYIPGLSEAHRRALQSANLRISSQPVDMRHAMRHAEIMLCHGGIGTTHYGLLSGLPILLLPINLEQELTARNVTKLGAGISVDFDETRTDFIAMLRELVMNPDYATKARGFARKYRDCNESGIMTTVALRCEELIAGHDMRDMAL
jgi:UDP:flavonoid glycosyltransferase YjiC (YdhE family)